MQKELLLALYIIFFAFVHSLTASRSFKKKAYDFVEPELYRFLYTLVSVTMVLPLLYLWLWNRERSALLYTIEFPYLVVSIAMIAAGLFLVLNSLITIDVLDFIGVKAALKRKALGEKAGGLIITGAYGITRHPLYLGGMLILWSNPVMRLVDFAAASFISGYLILGAFLEERKLEEEFGDEYRDYKTKVSMFLPLKWLGNVIRL